MCGRFVSTFSMEELVDTLATILPGMEIVTDSTSVEEDYNVAPTRFRPVVVCDGDRIRVEHDRWGLVPVWAKDSSVGSKMINARCESVAEKPSYKNLLKNHRCLVPLTGFFEWSIEAPRGKVPHYVTSTDDSLLFAAGLWSRSPILGDIHTFTMITRDAFAGTAWMHHRSPALLDAHQSRSWITEIDPPLTILDESTDFALRAWEVSTRVNSVKNNDATLLNPAGDERLF